MHDLRYDPQTGSVLNHLAAKDGALRNGYDCRPADERTATDIASLRADFAALSEFVRLSTGPVDVALDVGILRDKLDYVTARLERVEADNAALRTTVSRLSDTVQMLMLRNGQ